MAYETIITEVRGKVGLITLNRPKALNALNSQVLSELTAALGVFEGVVRKPIEMVELLFAIAHWTAPSSPSAGAALASRVVKTPQRRR